MRFTPAAAEVEVKGQGEGWREEGREGTDGGGSRDGGDGEVDRSGDSGGDDGVGIVSGMNCRGGGDA